MANERREGTSNLGVALDDLIGGVKEVGEGERRDGMGIRSSVADVPIEEVEYLHHVRDEPPTAIGNAIDLRGITDRLRNASSSPRVVGDDGLHDVGHLGEAPNFRWRFDLKLLILRHEQEVVHGELALLDTVLADLSLPLGLFLGKLPSVGLGLLPFPLGPLLGRHVGNAIALRFGLALLAKTFGFGLSLLLERSFLLGRLGILGPLLLFGFLYHYYRYRKQSKRAEVSFVGLVLRS